MVLGLWFASFQARKQSTFLFTDCFQKNSLLGYFSNELMQTWFIGMDGILVIFLGGNKQP